MNQYNQTSVKVNKVGKKFELTVSGRIIATSNFLDNLEEHAEFLDGLFDEVAREAYDEGQDDCEHCDDCDDAYEDGRERGIEEGESNCEECPECEECDDCPESEHEVERN